CSATAPSATRYILPTDFSTEAAATAPAERTLVIQPLRLAGFLDTAGILLQLDDITLNEASGHRWAEDLALQLQRGLRQRLGALLDGTRVLSDAGNVAGAYQLRVEVRAFHGRHDGRAVAAGSWQLRGPDGDLLEQRPFAVETPLRSDGYPALVRALGASW